jgi:glyoxylase-like metal-dependent hydrolase (beta-lactamase superfamily II)
MTWKNSVQVLASSLLLTVAVAPGQARAADPIKDVRLYAIECGRIEVKDLGAFADTGEYDGKPGTLAASCYLIRHPKGTLLWDTGLSDKLAENKAGVDVGGFKLIVVKPLVDQLKSIEVTPADVTYLAVSHFHFDHTGNANAFAASTWIINKAELAWAESTPTPFGVDLSTLSSSKTAKTQLIDGDFDVFGDGSIVQHDGEDVASLPKFPAYLE